MKILNRPLRKIVLMTGITLAATLLATGAPTPAEAQIVAPIVQCPPGYAYSGYSCVPAAPGYAAVYGPPVVEGPPPVYDTFALSFGLGGHGGGGHGHPHGHGHGGHPGFHH